MACLPNFAYAQKSWFLPHAEVRAKYDDNIFLTDDDEENDWIITVSPGIFIEPELRSRHKFICNYQADLRFFQDHDEQDSDNHELYADMELNFNKWRVNLSNMFRYFKDRDSLSREDVGESPTTEEFYYSYGRDRLGTDNISRVKRTQDYLTGIATFEFNKMDIALRGSYGFEDYHSDWQIGNFKGKTMTYKDLERKVREGEVEVGLKLWPKTTLLFSEVYGDVKHETGEKSDSRFYDTLIGLRGKPTAKIAVEMKIGYRDQDYDDYDDDFKSVIYNGSIMYELSSRDVLRLNFLRTTNDTVANENAYYAASYIITSFTHNFTDRFSGNLDFTYEVDEYPSVTKEEDIIGWVDEYGIWRPAATGASFLRRKEDFMSAGFGFSYRTTKRLAFDFQYEFRMRNSNFDPFDYENNRVSFGVRASF
jgi:hypothetical protein